MRRKLGWRESARGRRRKLEAVRSGYIADRTDRGHRLQVHTEQDAWAKVGLVFPLWGPIGAILRLQCGPFNLVRNGSGCIGKIQHHPCRIATTGNQTNATPEVIL